MSFIFVRRLIVPRVCPVANNLSRRFFARQSSVGVTAMQVKVGVIGSAISKRPCFAFGRRARFTTQTSELPEDFEASCRTLFFGCVNQKIPDVVLQDYFSAYGELQDCRLIRNFRGKSMGYGVATFKDTKIIDTVLNDVHEINKKTLNVERTQKYRVLKIEGIPSGYTPEQVKHLFSKFGDVEEVRIPENTDSEVENNYCLLRFSKQTEARRAIKNAHKVGEDLNLTISLLTSMTKDFTNLPTKKVLVFNLPFKTTVDELYRHLHFTFQSLKEIHLRVDVEAKQLSAFLLFDSEKDVEKIAKEGSMSFGGNQVLFKKVDDSTPLNSTSKSMFLENIPPELTRDDIRRHFVQFGRIEKTSVSFKKGFGLIRFYVPPSCQRATSEREHVINNHTVRVRRMALQ